MGSPFLIDDVAHGWTTLAAIKGTAMVRLNIFRRLGARADSLADGFFIDTATDANNHDNNLHAIENDCQSQNQLVSC